MGFINLQIDEPQHNAAFEGNAPSSFNGSVVVPLEIQDVPLYFRWYASSFSKVSGNTVQGYSMNPLALPTPDYTSPPDLGIGSHVISFAVSDRAGEKEPDFSAIKHAGVAGGEKGAHPCIIHVFKANIIEPTIGQQVSRANLLLKAEAPPLWDKKEYQDINRLAYRWLLQPVGSPAGRPSADSGKLGKGTQLEFKENVSPIPPSLTYIFGTGDVRFEGQYRITLLVTDATNDGIGEDSACVTVVF